MTTPSATSTKETTNFARLSRLVLDFGTPALRDIFDRIHPPKKLSSVLASNSTKLCKATNPAQKEKLYPTNASGSTPLPTVSSMDFDISLLIVLLKKICKLNPPPSTGNWNDPPLPSDTSQEADIVRINSFRNEVFAHAAKASVDDTTFTTIWTDIQDVIERLGGKKAEMDALKTECMDPVVQQDCRDQVRQMIEDEKDVKEKIESLEKKTEEKLDDLGKKIDGVPDVLHEMLDAGREKGSKLESELPELPVDVHGHTMEVDRIVELLTDDSTKDVAVVLVSGMPGIGKSTVSLQAGHKLKDDFGRIVKFCSLRDLHPTKNGRDTKDDEGERVWREILSKCQPDHLPAKEYPKYALLMWCRQLEEDLVLVLDNAEDAQEDNFKDSFMGLLTEMRTCSKKKIKFIITSRRTDIESTGPNLTVEKVTVEPLSEKDSIQVLKGVGRLQVDSNVSAEKLRKIAELCEHIPIVLRLASRLLSSDSEYSVDKLIDKLQERPTRILKCPVMMEVAFEKLSEPLRHSLIRLSVFSRSFERNAAEALLGNNCADHLTQLKERCFIQKRDNRYFLHLLIRSYARTLGEKKFPDVWSHGQQAFDEHFLAKILESAEMYMRKDKCKESFDLFNEERLNYETLIGDVSSKKIRNCKALRDAVSGCRNLAPYVEFCVPVKMHEDFLNGLLCYAQEQNETVHVVEILCLLHYEGRKRGCAKMHAEGLMDIASNLFEENRPAFEKSVPSEVFYRHHYGRYLIQDCEQRDDAEVCFKEALRICESYEKETSELISDKVAILEQMGHIAKNQGRKDEALQCYSQSLEFHQAHHGDHILTAFTHKIIAAHYQSVKDLPSAEENYMKAIDIMKRLDRAEHKEAIPTYLKLGICFQMRKMFDESRKTFEKGNEVADNSIEGNHKYKVWIKTRLALLLHSEYPDDVAEAVRIAKVVLEMRRQLGMEEDWTKELLEKICQTQKC